MVSGNTLACLPASAEIDEICERTCTGSPELGFGLCFAGVSCDIGTKYLLYLDTADSIF